MYEKCLREVLAKLGIDQTRLSELNNMSCCFTADNGMRTEKVDVVIKDASIDDEGKLIIQLVKPVLLHGRRITKICWNPKDGWHACYEESKEFILGLLKVNSFETM